MRPMPMPRPLLGALAALLLAVPLRAALGAEPLQEEEGARVSLHRAVLLPPRFRLEEATEGGEGEAVQAALRPDLRSRMLVAHRVFAFTASASLIGAEVVGIVNRVQLETGSVPRRDMEPGINAHRILAFTAAGTYWTAGILAWSMPGPEGGKGLARDRGRRDIHILLSIVHMIAMGLVEATGIISAHAAPASAWEPLMAVHTAAGFVCSGFTITAAIVAGSPGKATQRQ